MGERAFSIKYDDGWVTHVHFEFQRRWSGGMMMIRGRSGNVVLLLVVVGEEVHLGSVVEG